MQVEDRLKRTHLDIQRQIRQLIGHRFGRSYYLYLTLAAANEFKDIYMNAFRLQMRDMSSRQTEKILFGAMNLVYALRVAAAGQSLAQAQTFAAAFIEAQMDDWYDWGAADLSPATR